jgi:hypothetical protein
MGTKHMPRMCLLICCVILFASMATAGADPGRPAPADFVRVLVDADFTFTEAKLAVDAYVDPSVDTAALGAAIARLSDAAESMAMASGGEASDMERLQAVRIVLNTAGAWNEGVHSPTISTTRSARGPAPSRSGAICRRAKAIASRCRCCSSRWASGSAST